MDTKKATVKNLVSDFECTKFPEGNWHACCVRHDHDYAEGVNKWLADLRLGWCVLKKGHPIIGPAMWLGVTIFGWKAYNEHKEAREYVRSLNRRDMSRLRRQKVREEGGEVGVLPCSGEEAAQETQG